MRFFIALEIPQESRQELETVQRKLDDIIPGVRLTDNNKLHLTLAFVGEQPEQLKEKLAQVIQEATDGISSFKITPAYIDGFPSLHTAHTFWVGVKGDTDKLMVLRERIKDGLSQIGLDTDDRRFVPHVAIAKLNNHFRLQPDQEAALQKMMLDNFSPVQISSLKLFESIPEHGFHRHNTLAEIPLELKPPQSNHEAGAV